MNNSTNEISSDANNEKKRFSPGSLWCNRDFLLLWSGQSISTLGTQISALALPLLVLSLTGSPALAGFIAALQTFPYLVFSLPAGVLIDRWDRKKVMIGCDMIRVLAYGAIPLAYITGHITFPLLSIVALAGGIASVFFGIAEVSSLPRVVSPEQVSQASGVNAAAESGAQLLGPGIGGFIIGLARTTIAGAALAYLVDTCSYAVSVFSLLWVRVPFQQKRSALPGSPLHREMAEGVRFLWKHQLLRVIALLNLCMNFLVAPSYLAVIVLARGSLHADARTLGLILSMGSAGGILGSILAPKIATRFRYGKVILGTVFLEVCAMVPLAIAFSPILLVVGYALLSLGLPIQTVTMISYRLSVTPDALQGRVNSIVRLFVFGGSSLGLAVGGLLLSVIDPHTELWLMTGCIAFCAVAFSLTGMRKA